MNLQSLRLAIPKFHLPAHGSICWSRYSLNFIFGSGRVDGEAIERFWACSNPVATSTREMGHGTRHDFLEARWNMSNFFKLVDLGVAIRKRLKTAIEGREKHSHELEEFSVSFSESTISAWVQMIELFDQDPENNPDPYQTTMQGKPSSHTADDHTN